MQNERTKEKGRKEYFSRKNVCATYVVNFRKLSPKTFRAEEQKSVTCKSRRSMNGTRNSADFFLQKGKNTITFKKSELGTTKIAFSRKEGADRQGKAPA